MTFSCTKKVIDKIKSVQTISGDKKELHIHNWYVNQLILQRKSYFLFTNSMSIFSFIMYMGTKKETKQMGALFTKALQEELTRQYGYTQKYIDLVTQAGQEFEYCKTNSGSVLGSMNDFKYTIEHHVYHRGLSLNTINFINHVLKKTLMKAIPAEKDSYAYPSEVHKTLMDNLVN